MIEETDLLAICDEISEGKSLRSICRQRDLPESSVRRWLAQNQEAMAHSARARELGCDSLADECLEIADGPGDPQDKRLRIDTRIRLIGKWSQRYGDKVTYQSESTVTHRYDLDSLEAEKLEQLESILADARAGPGGAGEAEPAAIH